MLRNYIKIAFRNLFKQKIYSFINIGGLALGIAAFLMILQFVSLEKSVNEFHKNKQNIYRLISQVNDGKNHPEVEPGWAPLLKDNFPAVKQYCRVIEGSAQGIVQNPVNNLSARELNLVYAESNFFELFSFQLKTGVAGDLYNPDVCFIAESSAKKYFGNIDPMGKSLGVYNQFGNHTYIVKGVYRDMTGQSDIKADFVLSLETLKNKANLNGNDWAALDNLGSQYLITYLEIAPYTNINTFETKLNAFRKARKKEEEATTFRIQSLTDMHLGIEKPGLPHYGSSQYVYMLLSIAFMILLIAWFNYVNLNTANALKRANEVGVRKVIGATKSDLIKLFLTESVVVNILSFVIGIWLVFIFQPGFNQLVQRQLSFESLFLNRIWITGLALILGGSLLSGIYTAASLAKFKPVETLKGKIAKTAGGVLLRKSLVVAQFSISVALIISTIVIYHQLKFMQHKDLGFNTSQLLWIPAPVIGRDSSYVQRRDAYQNELAQLSFVKDYCTSGSLPGKGFNYGGDHISSPRSAPGTETKTFSVAIIGDRYLPVYNIQIVAGRNFTNPETKTSWENNNKLMVNESAARLLGFQTPDQALQNKVKWNDKQYDVIGVVKDYHHESLQKAISPMVFYPGQINDVTIKLTSGNMQDKIASLEKVFRKFFPGNPFEFGFVDEFFDRQYKTEIQFGKIFIAASILAIAIACLGLFGLTIYTVKSRTKEIGVRKVLGASVTGITALLTKDFVRLVLISIVIASPIAYYFMNKWLGDFAYRVHLSWWIFVLSGGVAITIAIVTIGFQAIKAAMANPVRSLRSE